jgi:hypothetical protein
MEVTSHFVTGSGLSSFDRYEGTAPTRFPASWRRSESADDRLSFAVDRWTGSGRPRTRSAHGSKFTGFQIEGRGYFTK